MIRAQSLPEPYQTSLTNSSAEILADTSVEKGSDVPGFRPHDLLEAALAACMNMTVRVYADRHGLVIDSVVTTVNLVRRHEESAFHCEITIEGDISQETRQKLIEVAHNCPVRKTLTKSIRID
jgi:putative redox protein